jgi:hypothetical protein
VKSTHIDSEAAGALHNSGGCGKLVVVGGLLRREGEKVVLRHRGWHPSHCPIQERARLRKKVVVAR